MKDRFKAKLVDLAGNTIGKGGDAFQRSMARLDAYHNAITAIAVKNNSAREDAEAVLLRQLTDGEIRWSYQ